MVVKRTGRGQGNRGTKSQRVIQGLFDVRAHALRILARNHFDLYLQVLHFAKRLNGHLILVDSGELANHIFNGRGINVNAANGDHVIAASEQPAIEAREGTAARAGREIQSHEIAGAITKDRKTRSAEIADDQFSGLARRDLQPRLRVNDFDNELALDDMNPSGLDLTFETVSTNFRGASVIEALGPPSGFDARLRARDVGAGFARVNQGTSGNRAQIEMLFACNFSQAQGIRWREANDRGA